MNKTRIVLDSNVILSAALFKNSSPRQAFDRAMTTGQIMMSTATLAELQEIFNRPKFDRYLSKSLRTDFLNNLIAVIETVEIIQSFSVCRDPKDDKFLELAVNGNADYIVTGDRDLLVLNPFQNIAILSVSKFLAL